jgi:hypothetical protein
MPKAVPLREVEYHRRRSRCERDAAYRLGDCLAADAHMRLSALHLERALVLEEVERVIGGGTERRSGAGTGPCQLDR